MTNNELSRHVLEAIKKNSGSAKFNDLVKSLGTDARAVFKNLFFLEEKGFVQLSTRYGSDSVYPQILLAKMRKAGDALLSDHARLDAAFPLSESGDYKFHPHPGAGAALTLHDALELLAERVRESLEGEEREAALEKIESLMALPFVDKPL